MDDIAHVTCMIRQSMPRFHLDFNILIHSGESFLSHSPAPAKAAMFKWEDMISFNLILSLNSPILLRSPFQSGGRQESMDRCHQQVHYLHRQSASVRWVEQGRNVNFDTFSDTSSKAFWRKVVTPIGKTMILPWSRPIHLFWKKHSRILDLLLRIAWMYRLRKGRRRK